MRGAASFTHAVTSNVHKMDKKSIEQKVNEALGSLDGMRRAEPGELFYEKLRMRMAGPEARVVPLRARLLWQAAACLLLLIVLNIFVWLRTSAAETSVAEQQNNPVAEEYFAYLNNLTFE